MTAAFARLRWPLASSLFLGLLLGCRAPSRAGAGAAAAMLDEVRREVTFAGAGGVRLAGTLRIPARAAGAKVPGAIIVAGSGPTDRDGNSALLSAKIDLLAQIAEELAREGIASLRYDKRGQYASQPAPEDRRTLEEFCLWESYVADAAAALAHLQEQEEIDGGRTAMIGHSEGGLLILQAAAEGKGLRQPPAALVLLCTPGRPLDIVLREQLSRDPVMLFFLRRNDEIVRAIRETGQVPDDVPAALAALYPPEFGRFGQSMFRFDAPAWASRFPGPVLVIAAERDSQQKPALDSEALAAGLRKRQPDDHEVYIAPRASHNLKRATLFDPHGFKGEIVPEAAAKLRSWLRVKLGPER